MIDKRSHLIISAALLVFLCPRIAAARSLCTGDDISAAAAQYDTVAVMPFQNATEDRSLDWLSMGIPETIMADLSGVGGIVLIERIQLWRIMEEQALQVAGAVSDASAMEIGQLIGANLLVVGAFQKQGRTLRITARLVEAESGSVTQTAKVTGGLNDIFDLQDELVSELAVNMNLSTAHTKAAVLVPELTKSVEAFQHFGQAALCQAQKDYQGAVEELRRAVALDPGFSLARDRFEEAFYMLEADNRWEYERVESSADNVESRSVYLHRAGGVSNLKGGRYYTYVSKAAGSSQGVDFIGRIVEYYEMGDDGIYLAGELLDPEMGSESLRIFSPSVLLFPYEMEVGRKWSTEHRVKERRPSGSGDVVYQQAAVLRKENIEIPSSGTLECFVIRYDRRVAGNGSPATVWFAPGVGVVKVEWQETGGKLSGLSRRVEMVLRDFHFGG